jgi:hypothetical protein
VSENENEKSSPTQVEKTEPDTDEPIVSEPTDKMDSPKEVQQSPSQDTPPAEEGSAKAQSDIEKTIPPTTKEKSDEGGKLQSDKEIQNNDKSDTSKVTSDTKTMTQVPKFSTPTISTPKSNKPLTTVEEPKKDVDEDEIDDFNPKERFAENFKYADYIKFILETTGPGPSPGVPSTGGVSPSPSRSRSVRMTSVEKIWDVFFKDLGDSLIRHHIRVSSMKRLNVTDGSSSSNRKLLQSDQALFDFGAFPDAFGHFVGFCAGCDRW